METIELPKLSSRRNNTHKGDYGKVLVIAGSENMPGAPSLSALGAFRAGAGMVRIATHKEILPHVLAICPTATGFPLSARDTKSLLTFADQHDAVVVGPGMGMTPFTRRIVLELLERHHRPMVLDADALNTLSALEASEWPTRRDWSNIVLTPHMGEFMRLMAAVMKRGGDVALTPEAAGQIAEQASASPKAPRSLVDDDSPSTADGIPVDLPVETALNAEVQASQIQEAPGSPDNSALAELLSRGTGCVVVLKGHRTVIADGRRTAINKTGNPGMATAGSGDVLAGVIAAMLGQRFSPLDAAVLGVHLHGLAGDIAAQRIGPAGLLATDIAAMLPAALQQQMQG